MKWIFLFFLIPSITFAAHVQCYSGSKLIYDGEATKLDYTGLYLIFTEVKSKNIVVSFGDCLVVFPPSDKQIYDEAAKMIKYK